jgi:mRNA-degrading endonuclease RelE of RelBE toxin-antitoxin system
LPLFEVRLTKTAEEDLQKIALKTQARILEKIKILEATPFPTIKPIKKIKGSKKIPLFRFRIGSYRVIYYVKESTVFILIVVNKREFDKELRVLVKTLNKHIIEEN